MKSYQHATCLILIFGIIFLVEVANGSDRLDLKTLQRVEQRFGISAIERVKSWDRLIRVTTPLDSDDQLYEVNKFFNQIEFKDDIKHWGKNDYWATPLEFLGTNAGDCEDFTIAKYVTLLELGIPDEKLRLMYVTATRPRQAHMVLAYYETPSSIPLVLDNINKRILPASQRRDLIPVYSFNGQGLWLAKAQGRGRQMQSGNNNKLWADVNNRMKNGF